MRKFIITNLAKGAVNIHAGQVVEIGGNSNSTPIPDNGIKVIKITENTLLSQIHNNAILLIEGVVILTIPTNLAQAFVSCVIDVKSGQCTVTPNTGVSVTGTALTILTTEVKDLYKEDVDNDNFRLVANAGSGGGGVSINDTTPSLTETYSSQKSVDTFVAKEAGKGLILDTEILKLDGIAENATANSSDSYLLNRANHTGTQAPSTITENSSKRFVSDTERGTWNNKQDKAPTDGKTYGLKDGGLVDLKLPLIIADATVSTAVTTTTLTLMSEYSIGILAGKKILKFRFDAKRTITGANSRLYVKLFDTVTSVETDVAVSEVTNASHTSWFINRSVPLNELGGVITTLDPTNKQLTNEVSTAISLSNITTSFSDSLKLRVYGLNISSASDMQQYGGLIEIF